MLLVPLIPLALHREYEEGGVILKRVELRLHQWQRPRTARAPAFPVLLRPYDEHELVLGRHAQEVVERVLAVLGLINPDDRPHVTRRLGSRRVDSLLARPRLRRLLEVDHRRGSGEGVDHALAHALPPVELLLEHRPAPVRGLHVLVHLRDRDVEVEREGEDGPRHEGDEDGEGRVLEVGQLHLHRAELDTPSDFLARRRLEPDALPVRRLDVLEVVHVLGVIELNPLLVDD
mmetsp:Transcript_21659/g.53028  ORF Transcript_21659/g.53028 Transcript_21659/m.53028 type:complete len:232 (+) Transcript_21659:999-1694(+)